MQKYNVVHSNGGKSVTIVAVNGDQYTRHASTTMNVSYRKDGGLTVWADGEHKSQTVRFDRYGRIAATYLDAIRK